MRELLDTIRESQDFAIDYAGVGSVGLYQAPYNYFFYTQAGKIDAIHDHMRGYESVCLKGAVRNNVYRLDDGGDDCVIWTRCPRLCGVGGCPEALSVLVREGVTPVLEYVQNMWVGDSYKMTHDQFHHFEVLMPNSITRQVWKPIEKPQTHIVRPLDYMTNQCQPREYTEDELWEIAYSCLAT